MVTANSSWLAFSIDVVLLVQYANNSQVENEIWAAFLFRVPRILSPVHRSLGMCMESGPVAQSAFSMAGIGHKEAGTWACSETHCLLHVQDIIKDPFLLLKVRLGDSELWWSASGQSWPSQVHHECVLLTSSSESIKPWAKTKVSLNGYFHINMTNMHMVQGFGSLCLFT